MLTMTYIISSVWHYQMKWDTCDSFPDGPQRCRRTRPCWKSSHIWNLLCRPCAPAGIQTDEQLVICWLISREIVIIVHKYSFHFNPTWTSFWYIPRGVPPGNLKMGFKEDEDCIKQKPSFSSLEMKESSTILLHWYSGEQEDFWQHDIEIKMLEKLFATCGQPKHKVSVGPRMESLETKHIAYLCMRWRWKSWW